MVTNCLSETCRQLVAAALVVHHCGSVPMPPPYYDHAPTHLIDVKVVSWGAVQRLCGPGGLPEIAPLNDPLFIRRGDERACTYDQTLIFVKDDITDHEKACHVRPNARFDR